MALCDPCEQGLFLSGVHPWSLTPGEGCYLAFPEDCVCEGPVEVWLQNVVDSMRAAVSAEFKAAIVMYDEQPRGKWIFDYSPQNTIVVSRTMFTADVNAAFEDLEEGNEDALKADQSIVLCLLPLILDALTPTTTTTWALENRNPLKLKTEIIEVI